VDRGRAGFRFEHLRAIGYETAEQLGVEPAQYFVRVTKRETRACKTCEEQGVRCAPLPPRIIEKGLASDRVVIDTVVSKYLDHLPLYRQSAILERETGLEISRATLDGWVMRVGELLRPISEAMAEELLSEEDVDWKFIVLDYSQELTAIGTLIRRDLPMPRFARFS
jgi:transposase